MAKCIFLRDIAKMTVQRVVLPIAYRLALLKHRGEKKKYVFADADCSLLTPVMVGQRKEF